MPCFSISELHLCTKKIISKRKYTGYLQNGETWLVKFRHLYDAQDMGQMEYEYNLAARKCGIQVPDFKLPEGKYFASKRFNLSGEERLHIAPAGALLNKSIRQPKLDYKILLHLTGFLTQNPTEVEEMFRRMVFNILTDNKDDHAKNFSFICRESKWSLAPTYDLTLCKSGYHGEHATSVNNNGEPSLSDILTVGESIRISKEKGLNIIHSVYENCQNILAEAWKNKIEINTYRNQQVSSKNGDKK